MTPAAGTVGSPAQVFARSAPIDAQDRADDRHRAALRAERQDREEGLAFLARLRGVPDRTHASVVAEVSARAELADLAERQDRRLKAERIAADRERRIAELEQQLEAERRRSEDLGRGLSRANELAGAFRRGQSGSQSGSGAGPVPVRRADHRLALTGRGARGRSTA